MRKTMRSRTVLTGLAVWAAFWPLAWAIPSGYLFDLVNALSVSIGVGIIVSYTPGILVAVRSGRPLSGPHYLVLGIVTAWAATTMRHIWSWTWRFLDKPEWMTDSPWLAFFAWVIFTGGVLHLTAKGAIEGEIPKENWIHLGIVVAIAVMLCLIVIFLLGPAREDIKDILIPLPPFGEPLVP